MFETIQYVLCCDNGTTFQAYVNMQPVFLMPGIFPNPQAAFQGRAAVNKTGFWERIREALR